MPFFPCGVNPYIGVTKHRPKFFGCFSGRDIWMCTLRAPSSISQSACSWLTCLHQTRCRARQLLNRCSVACLFMVFYKRFMSFQSHTPSKYNSRFWPVVVSTVLHKRQNTLQLFSLLLFELTVLCILNFLLSLWTILFSCTIVYYNTLLAAVTLCIQLLLSLLELQW